MDYEIDNEINMLRDAVDRLDAAMIAILSERFRVTEKIGELKAKHGLQPKDLEREKKQYQKLIDLCEIHDLDPEIARAVLCTIINEAIRKHQLIQERNNNPEQSK